MGVGKFKPILLRNKPGSPGDREPQQVKELKNYCFATKAGHSRRT